MTPHSDPAQTAGDDRRQTRIPYLAIHCPDGERTMLYRFYAPDGDLLYIGITNTPGRRWAAHSRHSEWWPRVSVLHTEWHETRAAAEYAEVQAIKVELPEHNRVHNGRLYRYTRGPFPAQRLHPITLERFGDQAFSFGDLVDQLGIAPGTVVAYGNRLVKAGKLRKVDRRKAVNGRLRNYFVSVADMETNQLAR